MAITRIANIGMESGDIGEWDAHVGCTPSTNFKKTGAYSLECNYQGTYTTQVIPSTYQARIGFWWYMNVVDQTDVSIVYLGDVYLQWRRYEQQIRLWANGSLQGSSPTFISTGTWYHLGLDVKKDVSTGWAYFYIDGVPYVTFDGNTNANQIALSYVGAYFNKPGDWYYDDIYIDDTTGEAGPAPLPLKKFYYVTPNAVGNYSQWNKSSGSGGYDLVDEVPPSDSDYIESDAVGEKESYNMTTYAIDTGEAIQAVIPIVRAAKSGVSEQIKLGTRLSSTDLQGSSQDLAATPDYVWERQTTKPGGGAWGQSDLDAFEVLVESSGSF